MAGEQGAPLSPIGQAPQALLNEYERNYYPTTPQTSSGKEKTNLSEEGQAALARMDQANAALLAASQSPQLPAQAPQLPSDTDQLINQVAAGNVQAQTGVIPQVAPPRQFTQDAQDPFQPPQATAERYSLDQMSATPEMQKPRTLAAAKDEARQYQAELEARVAKEKLDDLTWIQEERARRQSETANAIQARYREYADTLDKKNLWDNMPGWRKALVTIGIAAQHAGSGSSSVYDQLKLAMAQDEAKRKDKSDFALMRLKEAQMSPEKLDAWVKNQEIDSAARKQAQLELAQATINKMLAPYPVAQAAAAQDVAKLAAEQAADRGKLVIAHTGSKSSSSTMTPAGMREQVSGSKGGDNSGRLPPTADVQKFATAKVMAQKADKLAELTKQGHAPTPEQVNQLVENERQFITQAKKEGHSSWSNLVGRVGRAASSGVGLEGIFPSSVYPKEMSQETREWIRLERDLSHSEAVQFYGGMSWMTDPENYFNAMSSRGLMMGDTQRDIVEKGDNSITQAKTAFTEMEKVSKAGMLEAKMDRQAAAAKPRMNVLPPKTDADLAMRIRAMDDKDQKLAKDALKLKKSDPRYQSANKWLERKGLR